MNKYLEKVALWTRSPSNISLRSKELVRALKHRVQNKSIPKAKVEKGLDQVHGLEKTLADHKRRNMYNKQPGNSLEVFKQIMNNLERRKGLSNV